MAITLTADLSYSAIYANLYSDISKTIDTSTQQ